MNLKPNEVVNVNSAEAAIESVLKRLPNGWEPGSSLPDELLHVWRERIGAAEKKDSGVNWLEFIADLGQIRLRGTDESHCLLVSGSGRDTMAVIQRFISRSNGAGRLVFIIAASASALTVARSAVADSAECVFMDAAQVTNALLNTNWKGIISSCIRRSIPIRALIAFDIALSAQGGMFYGRGDELARLRDEVRVNFAIAGPGKIGKTSLVKEYHRDLKKRKKAAATFYVDFYECSDRSPNHWPRYLAMKVDGSSSADKVTRDDLPNFIRRLRTKLNETPTLILDEIDEIVSQSENTRQLLGSMEKQQLCRFIFCGRGELYKAARNSQSGLGGRFRLMRLEPLDQLSAKRLFIEPLEDLGLGLDDREKIADYVLHLTGGLPQLIQFYGQSLAEAAIRLGADTINQKHIDELGKDFETAQYFTSPLEDLSGAEARFVAYLLLQNAADQVSLFHLQALTRRHRIEFSVEEIKRICDELVIMNILAWTSESYHLANQGLRHYAKQFGLLDKSLEAAREQVWKMRGGKAPTSA